VQVQGFKYQMPAQQHHAEDKQVGNAHLHCQQPTDAQVRFALVQRDNCGSQKRTDD
jgi:hypothetical protein